MYYVNKNIKKTQRVFPEQGRYDYLRYDMNENPEGLPVKFIQEVLKNVTPEFLSVYPETDKFLNKYANYIGCDINQVLATNGSDMAIRYILEVFGEEGKKVVTVSPSFEMYWVNCSILGLVHSPVNYNDDLTINIQNIVDAIDEDTRIVVLLNPNNPIGNAYTDEEFQRVLDKTKEVNAILVVDEAYHYFYKNTFINHAFKEENVIILRTFSKLFSLAACRLGIVIANSKLIDYIKTSKLTFDVNSFALLFGEKILDCPEIISNLIELEKQGKEYILNDLNKNKYECIECKGNFIFIKTKRNPNEVTIELKTKKKILVHDYKNSIIKDYIRVSIGSKIAMSKFLDAFYDIDKY